MSKRLIRFLSREGEKTSIQQHGFVYQFSSDPRESRVIEKLNDFENEEKLFQTFDIVDHDPRYATVGAAIYAFINARLRGILKCPVHLLVDEHIQDIICSSFFKSLQKRSAQKLESLQHTAICRALGGTVSTTRNNIIQYFKVYICHCMKNIFKETHEPVIAEQYHKLQEKFDDECTALLDQCFFKNERLTRTCLEINYMSIIRFDGDETEETLELMFLASLGRAQNFLAHPCCQRAIERRWQPGYKVGQLYRVFYILFYAFVLVTMTRKNIKVNDVSEFWDEVVISTWQISYLVEMAMQVNQHGFQEWCRTNKADFFRNLIIMTYIILLCIAILIPIRIVRIFAIPLADFAFYLSFVYATIRSLRILNVDAFFGSIVLMIRKMFTILLKFLFVFLVFWFTYAVCHISLAGHYKETPNITDITLPWLLFINGAFEIFGEADDEDKTGNVSDCTQASFNWDDITESSVQCWFKTTMVPIVLFSYMLVSSIMLVNLVTALLTKKYEEVSRYSHIYWKCKLYDRLVEYEEKLWVPSPFSIFYYTLRGSLYLIFSALAKYGINSSFILWLPKLALSFLNNFEGYSYLSREKHHRIHNSDGGRRALNFIEEQRNLMVETILRERLETKWFRKKFESIIRRHHVTEHFRSRTNPHSL